MQKDAYNYLDQFPETTVGHFFSLFNYNIAKYICCKCISEERMNQLEMKKTLEVIRAPEPDDVIWQNLHFTFEERFIKSFIGHSISFLIVISGFIVILILTYLQVSFLFTYKERFRLRSE